MISVDSESSRGMRSEFGKVLVERRRAVHRGGFKRKDFVSSRQVFLCSRGISAASRYLDARVRGVAFLGCRAHRP